MKRKVIPLSSTLLNQMQNKISWSRLNYEISYFLSYPKTESKIFSQHGLLNFIESEPFLKNIRHSTAHVGTLNLYKLTSANPNDHISFDNLFKNILNNDINSKITKQEILKWRSLLRDHKKMINKVREIRNKVIGHTDLVNPFSGNYRYEDVLSLLNTCQVILDEIIEIENLEVTAERVLAESLPNINGHDFLIRHFACKPDNSYLFHNSI